MRNVLRMACLMCLVAYFYGASAETIIIAADTWCPFNCEPKSDKPGYLVELAKKVFEAKGMTVEYRIMPWARAIEECRAGSLQGIIGAAKDDAPDFVFPTNELGKGGTGIFCTKESKWTYQNPTSLTAISLGIIADYSYGDELDPYIKENKNNSKRIQTVSGDNALETNIQKLMGGRIDALVETTPVFWYTANKMGLQDKVKLSGTAKEQFLYIAFSPKNPKSKEYATALSDGIAGFRKSGELSKILGKYGLKDWKK